MSQNFYSALAEIVMEGRAVFGAKAKDGNKRLWVPVLLVMAIVGYSAWLPPTEKWTDEAVGHDGRVLTISRTVEFLFGGGELHSMVTRYPSRYSLEFTNPSNGRRIRWHGEKYVRPVLLDVVDGTPWLVVFSNAIYSNSGLYGCPEVPYAFLAFDSSKSRWLPKPASEAPIVLTTANLSYGWWKHFMEHKPLQTSADIQGHYSSAKSESGGAFSPQIPRTYSAWNYKYKKQEATSRRPRDCRPLDPPVDSIFPNGKTVPSRPVQLEVLEVKDFDPEWVIKGDALVSKSVWSMYAWDEERTKACNALTRPADPEDRRLVGWRSFVGDPSGKLMFAPSHMLCEQDAIWFFNYVYEAGKVTIVKTNAAGEILYRISFSKPDQIGGYLGSIMAPTFRSKDGYLNFEWWNSNQSGSDRRINRSMKVRLLEPS